ncbi:Sexual development regulator velC [Penicillium rolfsii]|nr:Sexual development regulator velC [Penicillium rolfsii]
MASPIHSEKSSAAFVSSPPPMSCASSSGAQQETHQPPRNPSYSMPRGFDKLLHHEPESSPEPPPRRPSSQSRYHLHVRQHPIAARACGAGDRDRRPVDPPPIVQILLTDFDADSQDDRDILQDPRFTVGCLLFPVPSATGWTPSSDAEPNMLTAERDPDGVARADDSFSTPLLSGKAFMSPFFVEADPDPNSAPTHPSFSEDRGTQRPQHGPQSDSLRNASKLNQPATFFIFADLSIRSAGLYRLQFRLMNWGSVEDTGQSMPILAEAWSNPFRVYAAKDFPGMRDSSILAEGLKELGFVELKTRGNGKGKGRKRG